MEELPSRRTSVRGVDLDGNQTTLAWAVSRQLYRCPSCRNHVPIGSEHVIVRVDPVEGPGYHQHWHRTCALTLKRNLRDLRATPSR